MAELFAGSEAEFEEGDCKIIVRDDLEIGVFRVGPSYYAYRNHCVHQGGPVCQGRLFRHVEEILGEDQSSLGLRFAEEKVHIVCPWHGYEYDIRTGAHPADPDIPSGKVRGGGAGRRRLRPCIRQGKGPGSQPELDPGERSMETRAESVADLEQIHHRTDTRDILAHAKQQAEKRNYRDYVIFDVDSHHSDNASWREVVEYIEDPVVRAQAIEYHSKVASPPFGVVNNIMYYQDVGGRIQHQAGWREPVEDTDVHTDVTIVRRAMESFGTDYMVVFPTKLLDLGKHPDPRTEALLARAYNRWLVEHVLSGDDRIKSLLYLPFSTPEEAVRTVEEFSDQPGVIGFHADEHPEQAGPRQPVHEALRDPPGARHAIVLPRRLLLGGRAGHGPDEQVHRRSRRRVRPVEPDPHDQLGGQRTPGAIPRPQGHLDRERPGLAAVPHAGGWTTNT